MQKMNKEMKSKIADVNVHSKSSKEALDAFKQTSEYAILVNTITIDELVKSIFRSDENIQRFNKICIDKANKIVEETINEQLNNLINSLTKK